MKLQWIAKENTMKCYSVNEEDFFSDFSQVVDEWEDELGSNPALSGRAYWEGDANYKTPSHFFDIDSLIDSMKETAVDEYGECAYDFMSELQTEKVKEFELLIKEWLNKNVIVDFYSVDNIKMKCFTKAYL